MTTEGETPKTTQADNNTWRPSGDAILLFSLIALLLIPLWTTKFVPTQDGPLHVANAVTLVNYGAPEWETAREFYQLNDPRFPTWLFPLVLGWLAQFTSPMIAEKLLLSIYIIGIPLAFSFAIRPLTGYSNLGGLLVLPVVYNYTMNMGFYAFLLGIVMFLILIGVWLRSQTHLSIRITLIALLVSYFAFQIHPFSWVMTALALGAIEFVEYIKKIRIETGWREKFKGCAKLMAQRWYLYAATLLPGTIHTKIFLNLQDATTTSTAVKIVEKVGTTSAAWDYALKRFDILLDRVVGMFSLSSLVSYSLVELVISVGLLLSIVLLTILTTRAGKGTKKHRLRGRLLFLATCYAILYLITKDAMIGGAFVACRVQLLGLLSLLAWLGSSPELPRYRALVYGLSIALVSLATFYYTSQYQRFSRAIDRELSMASEMREGATYLPVVMPNEQIPHSIICDPTPNPFLHADGHFAYLRHSVDLGNYQGWKGYFPLSFRDHLNPVESIAVDGKIELEENEILPELNLEWGQKRGVIVEYVVVVGSLAAQSEAPEIRSLQHQLEHSYRQVAGDEGSPSFSLFQRVTPESL
jgi:hypothetical protein